MAGILGWLAGGESDPVKRQAMTTALSSPGGLWAKLGAYRAAIDNAPAMEEASQILRDAYTPAQKATRDFVTAPAFRVAEDRDASFDFDAAQKRFLGSGNIGMAEKLMELQQTQRKAGGSGIDWTGTLKDALDEQGNPVLLGMTNRGPEVIKGFRPKDEAPKAPTTRTVEHNGVKVTEEWDGTKFVPIAKSAANPTPQSIIYDANGSAFFVDPRNPSAPPRPILMADGKPIEKPAAAGKAPTEGERTSAGYLSRMEAAEQRLGGLNPLGTKGDRVASSFAPGSDSIMKNWLMSNEGQLYQQAAMDWIRAKLRKESGAAIGQDEAEQEYRTYFPMPGDGPDKIRQKAAARKEAMKALQFSAGSAYRPNGAAAGGLITVRAPNGKVYTFPDKKSADNFKLKAGIR